MDARTLPLVTPSSETARRRAVLVSGGGKRSRCRGLALFYCGFCHVLCSRASSQRCRRKGSAQTSSAVCFFTLVAGVRQVNIAGLHGWLLGQARTAMKATTSISTSGSPRSLSSKLLMSSEVSPRGNHLSNTTCLTQVFFKRGE